MVTQIGQRFKNKVMLVTGAAHGIGRAIALRFGSEGGQVIVNDVNVKSVFLCSFRAAQVMARRHQGVIINMSSGGATRAHRGMAAYDASKGGIEALTRAMA